MIGLIFYVIRCLSAITLATRCMEPAFRMHLRAHGTVAEFCKELDDAPQHAVRIFEFSDHVELQ